MKVNTDVMPNDLTRHLLESVFDAKVRALPRAVPAKLKHKIGEMIEEEIARHKQK